MSCKRKKEVGEADRLKAIVSSIRLFDSVCSSSSPGKAAAAATVPWRDLGSRERRAIQVAMQLRRSKERAERPRLLQPARRRERALPTLLSARAATAPSGGVAIRATHRALAGSRQGARRARDVCTWRGAGHPRSRSPSALDPDVWRTVRPVSCGVAAGKAASGKMLPRTRSRGCGPDSFSGQLYGA